MELLDRVGSLDSIDDLNRIITRVEKTIEIIPDSDPLHADGLTMLAKALWRRFELTESIRLGAPGLRATPRSGWRTPAAAALACGGRGFSGMGFHRGRPN